MRTVIDRPGRRVNVARWGTGRASTSSKSGVGFLVELAVKLGRKRRADLQIGICGEHGGDPAAIDLCHRIDLDYVSCSPYRVPVARLAAAHAALREAD